MAWILRLEDQRVLRDPPPPAPVEPPVTTAPVPKRGKKAPPAVAPAPPPAPPDLTRLLSDSEARVRRRAALAIGRVGLAEGASALLPLLASDPEPEVRQMAAFAIGLLGGDPLAGKEVDNEQVKSALVAALSDGSALVRGSAAEALGLLGDGAAADPIARMIAQAIQSGALATTPADDDDARRDTPTAACRLGLFALTRLKAYDALAGVVLDGSGQPRVRWWPVAYALQRIGDKRALQPLLTLAKDGNPYTRAFAVKGLATLRDPSAIPTLLPLLSSGDRAVLIETIRALGSIGEVSTIEPLRKILHDPGADRVVKVEAIAALGGIHPPVGGIGAAAPGVMDDLLDLLSDPYPPTRAAALKAASALDPDGFLLVLSSLDPDPNWTVRSALATVLGTLKPDVALARLGSMLNDSDQRVLPSVLAALTRIKAPNVTATLIEHLKAEDPAVRAAAAASLGELKPSNGSAALSEAYRFGQRDTTYIARAAALAALAKYGNEVAGPVLDVLEAALRDKDWAVRVRAAMLIKERSPASAAGVDARIRPAPTTVPADLYKSDRLTTPPVSTEVFIDTDKGSIEVELAVLDAPLTVESFTSLARRGFFNGLSVHRVVPDFVIQDGDPRGDGEGGPGYTIRDELNERPFLRGTIGMALDPWRDTGGSQWFVTHSPQPHLDARYTVFGRVVAGMDIVDRIELGDVVRRIRVWDGQTMTKR